MNTKVFGLTVALGGCSLIANVTSASAQVPEPLIVGTVNANGTSQNATKLFTIAHPSAGRYVVTFVPFVFGYLIPACIVMPLGSLTVQAIVQNVSYCDFTIASLNGTPTDTVFNFFAAPITH